MPLALSQIPQGFNYQAIARDGSGAVIAGATLQVRFYIRSESSGGTLFYQELHSSVSTNSFGLFTLVIGTGTPEVGSFNLIDWSVSPKWLETDIFHGGWKDLGVAQLYAVPYAMTAGDITGTVDKLAVKGTTTALDEALFEVKNKNGQTIFAVYNEGVRIYVDDAAKGPKGGFAVGGFDMTKATKKDYLIVNDDSVRIYLDNNPLTKGKKSGFAVGGYDISKGTIQNYLDVSDDSVRVYIDNSSTKSLKGGFAVGGFDANKTGNKNYMNITPEKTRIYTTSASEGFGVGSLLGGSPQSYMKLTPDNYFIGHQSGASLTTGLYNSFIGYNAGLNNTIGNYNIFIGYQSGFTNTDGEYNTFLGYQAGYSNEGSQSGSVSQHGRQNCYYGYQAGYLGYLPDACVMIGYKAGYSNQKNYNTFIGYMAGNLNNDGRFNTFLGALAGSNSVSGSENVFLGDKSGAYNVDGFYNVYVGTQAGYMSNGSSNVIIGWNSNYQAFSSTGERNVIIGAGSATYVKGNSNILIGCGVVDGEGTLDNQLFIENCGDVANPMINGDFANSRIAFHARATTYPLQVGTNATNGNGAYLSAGGVWTNTSSKSLKDRFVVLDRSSLLSKISDLTIEGWYYKGTREYHIGPFAEDFYNAFGTGDGESSEAEKFLSPSDVAGVALTGVQELIKKNLAQDQTIENQRKELESQQQQIDQLKILVEKLMNKE